MCSQPLPPDEEIILKPSNCRDRRHPEQSAIRIQQNTERHARQHNSPPADFAWSLYVSAPKTHGERHAGGLLRDRVPFFAHLCGAWLAIKPPDDSAVQRSPVDRYVAILASPIRPGKTAVLTTPVMASRGIKAKRTMRCVQAIQSPNIRRKNLSSFL